MMGQDAPELVPVILSGGKGTRLWPVSREARPKPFLKLADGRSLLQSTLLRAASLRARRVLIVTNKDYYFQTCDDVDGIKGELGEMQVSYLLETEGRNTAPAVAMATRFVREQFGEEAVLLVVPSDHLVQDHAAFRAAVRKAVAAARAGHIITFGIEPTSPETGFGYIEMGDRLQGLEVRKVLRFIEKPDRVRAQDFVAGGQHAWNSGMFCFSVNTMARALEKHAGEIASRANDAWKAGSHSDDSGAVFQLEAKSFGAMPDISIDYAVMEKAANIAVVPADLGWSDIGSWEAMSDLVEPDSNGNKVIGRAVLVDSRENFIQSEQRLIATVGVENLVIVDTADALLVGMRSKAQQVKDVVEQLRLAGDEAGLLHRTVHRPWGTYTVIEETDRYKIKRLAVKPGAALSLQLHRHRSEHWVVVEGIARVTNGEKVMDLVKDQSTYIPAGNRHRLENPGKTDVVIIETQTGDYLGEDDILRFDDQYGRAEDQG